MQVLHDVVVMTTNIMRWELSSIANGEGLGWLIGAVVYDVNLLS